MTKFNFLRKIALGFAVVLMANSAIAADGAALQQADTDLTDKGSLQRGAKLFMNNCSGCHSLNLLRYSRMATDLGLTEKEVMDNLNFTGAKFGEQIGSTMAPKAGERWFGKAPPDLSLVSRSRGPNWVYSYLKSFYLDPTRPLGWNNTVFPNASMPNPFFAEQGMQHAVYGKPDAATGDPVVESLKVTTPGNQTPAQYDQTIRDVTAFLEYAGEPAGIKREGMGAYVLAFLALLTFLAFLLKNEYWKDVEH